MNSITLDHGRTRADEVHIRDLVRSSGSSFFWAMRCLPRERRQAMYAVYAFCREVDDIADEPGSTVAKREALDQWRGEIDALYDRTPTRATSRALAPALERFPLDRRHFHEVIDGVEMDANGPIVAPGRDTLLLYCDRVAAAVGRLSVCIFGENNPRGMAVARHLGTALQLTNILRDLDEDAAAGRLYLPREALDASGVPTTPAMALAHPALPDVCALVAGWASSAFDDAASAMRACDHDALRPARMMMDVYRCTFDRLQSRGWAAPRTDVGPGKATKLWIAMRAALRPPTRG